MQRQLSLAPSSNVKSAVYDDESLELTVTFKGGQSYTVFNVPTTLPDEFEQASSPGRFYNESIKDLYVIAKA